MMLPGIPVTIGGTVYVMPPLNAKASKLYWPRMQAMQEGREDDPLGLVSEVTLACLRRNYPELQADVVEDYVDLDNFEELMVKATGKGAFRRWMEQQAALGNLETHPTLATAGTGEPSTPASPPQPGTDTPTSTS